MIGQVVVLGGSVYYLAKKKSVDALLMVIGSFFGILTYIFQLYVFPFIIQKNEMDSVSVANYYYIFYGINVFFSLIFAIGFVVLVGKFLKK